MSIYAIGVDGDYTFHEFLRQCSRRKVRVYPVNLRALVLRKSWHIDITESTGCLLHVDREEVRLNPRSGVFFRPFLPSRVDVKQDKAIKWENLVQGLSTWLLYHQVNVVNCPRGRDFNSIKSLHEQILSRYGFNVPKSLTTADSSHIKKFVKKHKTIIKTHCGVRANARIVDEKEVEQYDARRGPLHLQEYISGDDIRSHVVGKNVFSTKIRSAAVDYRSDPVRTVYSVANLGEEINKKLIMATRELGLSLAGWDFKIDRNGKLWTLEANSMPGYAGYDRVHHGKTSAAIIEALTSRKDRRSL